MQEKIGKMLKELENYKSDTDFDFFRGFIACLFECRIIDMNQLIEYQDAAMSAMGFKEK